MEPNHFIPSYVAPSRQKISSKSGVRFVGFRTLIALLVTFLTLPLRPPLAAQDRLEREQSANEMMGGAVTQPLEDINLKKKGVPPELTAIRDNPYDLKGIRTCRQIIAEVAKLETVMDDDFDRVQLSDRSRKRKEGASSVTRGPIASLIPFRALIREASGARVAEADYREAIYAGVVRRSFLKGLGSARRCKPPGRPLTAMEGAQIAADQILKDDDAK